MTFGETDEPYAEAEHRDDLPEDQGDEADSADDEDGVPCVTQIQIGAYDAVKRQLESFANEIGIVSKKKPDSPLNTFKLKLLNETLSKANSLLGDKYRPFSTFTLFDVEGSLPTASDVSVILSQYLAALGKFRTDHTDYDEYHGQSWRMVEDVESAEEQEDEEPEEDDDDEGEDEDDEADEGED